MVDQPPFGHDVRTPDRSDAYSRGHLAGTTPLFTDDPYPNQSRVIVPRFFMTAVPKKQADGSVKDVDVEMVELLIAGDNKSAPVHKVTDHHRQRWGRQYEAFRRGVDVMVHQGTALENWPILAQKPSMIRALAHQNIFTVEALADLPDTAVQGIGMGGVMLREQAKAFVEMKSTSEPIEMLTEQNARLTSTVEMLQQQITDMQANATAATQAAAAAGGTVAPDVITGMQEQLAALTALVESSVAKPKGGGGRKARPPEVEPDQPGTATDPEAGA